MEKNCEIPREHKASRATEPEKWLPVCRFSAQKRGGHHGPWSHCSAIFQQEEHAADKLNGRLGAASPDSQQQVLCLQAISTLGLVNVIH